MMVLVRLIDLLVRMAQFLATPEARFLRAGLLVVLICGALTGVVAIVWLITQIPAYLAGPAHW